MRKRTFAPRLPADPNLLVIGHVVGVFGLNGMIKVQPMTDFLERFEAGRQVTIKRSAYKIVSTQWHKEQARLKLDSIETIEQAEKLIGGRVYGLANEPLTLEKDEYLVRDILGYEVVDEQGQKVGVLEEVIPAPANDVFRVAEYLIPVVKEFVISVNQTDKRIVVRLLRGMAGLDPARPAPKPPPRQPRR